MALELVPEDDEMDQDGAAEGAAKKTRAETPPIYNGPERRMAQRRVEVDRREMMRFEAKSGRRSGSDRRRPAGLWNNRDF